MSDLKQRYREALNSRIEALERALGELDSGSSEAEESIRRITHSLTGSGGSYGFPEVSAAARGIEDADREELPSMVEELLGVLRATASDTVSDARMTILLVEDDPDMAHLMKHVLSSEDREILVAGSGSEARATLAERVPKLILLDLTLPDVDGRDILIHIRDQPVTAQVPVIVISGKTSAMARSECYALGADDFVVKPFDPQVVHDTVARHLEGRAPQEPEHRAGGWVGVDLSDPAAAAEGFRALQEGSDGFSLTLFRLNALESKVDRDSAEARDRVMEAVCDVIRRELSEGDVLSRWSAQELVLLLSDTEPNRATDVVENLGQESKAGTLLDSSSGLGFEILSGTYPVRGKETIQQAFSGARARLSSSVVMAQPSGDIGDGKDRPPPILLAEDDDMTASLLQHRLGRAGYEVVHYDDGQKAWDEVKQGGYSLVILDVKLPGMEGFEILGKMKSNDASADIPVILLTAMGREEDVVRGFELGAADYVQKPFSPMELVARVRRLLLDPLESPLTTTRGRDASDQDELA